MDISWSKKYKKCNKCWTIEIKHKWRWLCLKCYDKQRAKKQKRKEVLRNATRKYIEKNKLYEKYKKSKIESVKKYYKKNKEALQIIRRVRYRFNKWLKCLEFNINWKIKYLPFESLEKPNKTTNNLKKYDEWKKNMEDFKILKNYYLKNVK